MEILKVPTSYDGGDVYRYRKMTLEARKALLEERRARGYPEHELPHPYRFEGYYLITAATEHRPLLKEDAFAHDLLHAFQASCTVNAWVVLPNHYHLLVFVDDFAEMAQTVRRLHGRASTWNVEDETTGRKCWFRYTDRAIRSERHYWATVNYLHYNPVKHGYAASPYWHESCVGWYLLTEPGCVKHGKRPLSTPTARVGMTETHKAPSRRFRAYRLPIGLGRH